MNIIPPNVVPIINSTTEADDGPYVGEDVGIEVGTEVGYNVGAEDAIFIEIFPDVGVYYLGTSKTIIQDLSPLA
jgi:hypothetical protein